MLSESAKEQQIAELEMLINHSYDGLAVSNNEGVTIIVNQAWDRLTGLKREEVIGIPLNELVDKGVFSESVTMKVQKTNKTVTILQKMKSGKQAMITGSPVFDEKGNLYRVIINIRDVTELYRMKEELDKGQLLAEKYHVQISQIRLRQSRDENIVAESKAMQDVLNLAMRVGRVDSTVLLLGESGVGKEVVTRFIFSCSQRGVDQPFIRVNCGAIPEELLESELFGYESGAFTGARKGGKPGMFELANGGMLFLDEIAELPLKLQVKLLHVLQEREIMRVGGITPIKVDIRIIAATNKNLPEMIKNGVFREDLYYRLNVVPIQIPPLRFRKEDILPLAAHYLTLYNQKYSLKKVISSELMDEMIHYEWPGNVRELANVIERMVVTSIEDFLTPKHFSVKTHNVPGVADKIMIDSKISGEIQMLKHSIEVLECELIDRALQLYGTQAKAADILGISLSSLARKLKKYKSRS